WIELDGRRVGASSLTLDGVPPGVYALRITKTGFRPVIRRIRLGPGERVALRVALAPVAPPRRSPPAPQWIVRLQDAQRPRSIPTPAARPGAVYLVTLPALAGVTQYNRLDQVVLAGVVYRRALVEYRNWWQGRSRRDREWRVVYRLGGRYARFRARAGLEDGAPPEVTASFEVRGDGVTLFAGALKRAGDAPDVIDVDVAGVVELELIARATDPFYTRGVGVIWADPHLVPAPAGAPTPSAPSPAAGDGPARQERP
ncbi:MAG: NPCBM/NEW2 domain-containing protein, partial [Armatimonadota bacterium]|nr:NPCBM/NEW2 domain-containing protein [Armatimonadota bacterium]